jgi:hypothetical protein
LDNHPEVISNPLVFSLIQDTEDTFYSNCKRIASIYKPIKETIHHLEAKTTNMADCLINLVKIAVAIKIIPNSNPFRVSAIQIFNRRYKQFDINLYLLTYFLHPKYRGQGLHTNTFRIICETAVTLYKNLYHDEASCRLLISELISFKSGKTLDFNYDSSIITPLMWWDVVGITHIHIQELAKILFAITPSQASCERNFSVLKWFYGSRRTKLNLERLESMAKIHSFYLSQINSELKFYGKELSEDNLRQSAINETMYTSIANDMDVEFESNNDFIQPSTNEVLEIQEFINFTNPIFGGILITGELNQREVIEGVGNMDFNIKNVVDSALVEVDNI